MVTDAENHQIRKKNCRKGGFCLHTGWRKTIKEWLVKKLKLTLLWNEGPSLCYESRGTYFSARLDFPTHPLSAPGSPRMRSTKRWECLSKTLVQGGERGWGEAGKGQRILDILVASGFFFKKLKDKMARVRNFFYGLLQMRRHYARYGFGCLWHWLVDSFFCYLVHVMLSGWQKSGVFRNLKPAENMNLDR